jgi:glycosyltransferase involved in cell wall biosynthesis
MKIILIGPGMKPIPPSGWGAIESLIWDYYENLTKQNIETIIINDTNLSNVIDICNMEQPDVIHIMYDDYINIVPFLRCNKILYTSHYAFITNKYFQTIFNNYFNNMFSKVIANQDRIQLNALSSSIGDVYKKHGYTGKMYILSNGARSDLFKYTTQPTKSNKSVYVAKIEERKRQYLYQCIEDIDFIGNYHNSTFDINNANYLGEWKKKTLYGKLTEYGNLLLLSSGEADPLVTKEALIAGLGIVVNEISSANLDLTKEFITVIPNDKLDDIEYIEEKIKKNREYSVKNRNEIREYALENFSWDSIIKKYIKNILELD